MMGLIKKLFGFGADKVEQAQNLSERAKEVVTTGVREVENAVDASQEVVSSVSNKAGDVIDNVASLAREGVVAVLDDDMPTPPNAVTYIDREDVRLPFSNNVSKALELVGGQQGKVGIAHGLRIYEYGVASAHAFDFPVDKELLALSSLFSGLGSNAGEQAYAFCIIQGMWEGLAEKVKSAIENKDTGIASEDLETRALALGVKAESYGGQVPYINKGMSAVTRKRHGA